MVHDGRWPGALLTRMRSINDAFLIKVAARCPPDAASYSFRRRDSRRKPASRGAAERSIWVVKLNNILNLQGNRRPAKPFRAIRVLLVVLVKSLPQR